MSFKIRDLMISVLPGAQGAAGTLGGCRTCTGTTHEVCAANAGGTARPIAAAGGCPACTGTIDHTTQAAAAAPFGYGCPTRTVGCTVCTGTVIPTGHIYQGCWGHTDTGCTVCTGTVPPTHHHHQGCWAGTGNGCPTCTGTTGAQAYWGPPDNGCIACTGTTATNAFGFGTGTGNGCQTCTGTTHDALAAQAAAVLGCTVCTGASPQLGKHLPQALAQLRQQLQGLLSEVEAEEKRMDAELFPKSVEEAEDLEKKLEDALAEVRTRKGGLPKKG